MAQQFCAYCGRPAGAGHEPYCEAVRRERDEARRAEGRQRRTLLAVAAGAVLFLVLAGLAKGQEVGLKVEGAGVKVVQIDQTVIQKVDRTLVSAFPFSVQATGTPGALFFWSYPPAVKATDLNERLEVTAAPVGELTVNVKVVSPRLDKDGRFLGFDTRLGRVTFYVGEVGPAPKPPEPKPDVEPTDPLYQPLKAAWLKEADKAKRDTLAEVYSLLSDEAKAPGIWLDARTVAEFSQRATAARKAAIGEALPLTRAVLTAELNKTLPTATAATMGQHRAAVAAFYGRIADLLRRLP
jgi:hypothetical protein